MPQTTIDAAYRVLGDGEAGNPDYYVGEDDFGANRQPSGGSVSETDPNRALAQMVRNPGMSVTRAAFIAAPAVYGYSLGTSPMSRALGAGLGAALGAMIYEYTAGQGWVE